jgi:hypothetical protein
VPPAPLPIPPGILTAGNPFLPLGWSGKILGLSRPIDGNGSSPIALLQANVQSPFRQTDWPRASSFQQPLIDNFELIFLPAGAVRAGGFVLRFRAQGSA